LITFALECIYLTDENPCRSGGKTREKKKASIIQRRNPTEF
jgi:hypothetical protein